MFFQFLHLKRCFRHKYHFTEMLPPFNFLTQYISSFYYIHIAYHGSWHFPDIQQMLAEFVKEYYHLDINLSHLQQNRAWRGESYQRKCLPVSDWITGKKVQKWSEVSQSCPTLCSLTDCSLPGYSIDGIFQARILEWVALQKALCTSPKGTEGHPKVFFQEGQLCKVWSRKTDMFIPSIIIRAFRKSPLCVGYGPNWG